MTDIDTPTTIPSDRRHAPAGPRTDAESRRTQAACAPSPARRIAFIGNSLPRRCGIATFTTDLRNALAASPGTQSADIVAMNDPGRSYAYPECVRLQIDESDGRDFQSAAAFLNSGRFDVVSLQHEFGIYGGEAGENLIPLLERLEVPVVTTFHTVLADPPAKTRAVLGAVIRASRAVVVMAELGRTLLRDRHHVPASKIVVIPHGVPDVPFGEPDAAKTALGFEGRSVILTFGLLSPNKGIEVMIDAMPAILKRRPDAAYVVLGATHPNLVRSEGEAYRRGLAARAEALGVGDRVVFLDHFVDQATLQTYISMADVYVTPYLSERQMTSGTLAMSFGLGKAVVSTPYWHAQELLADGRGVLVPFGDADATGEAVGALLADPALRNAMRRRAYASSRAMTWDRTAEAYKAVFARARGPGPASFARPGRPPRHPPRALGLRP